MVKAGVRWMPCFGLLLSVEFLALGSLENEPPTAEDVSVTTTEGTPVAIELLGADEDGDSLAYEILSQPSNGRLSGSEGKFTYEPDEGFIGTDVFTYCACDGEEYSNTATVTVVVTSNSQEDLPSGSEGETTADEYGPADDAGIPIAAGWSHCLALTAEGNVWGWGWNCHGQVGDGTEEDRAMPVRIQGLGGISAVGGGHWHSVALKADGTVWVWGDNRWGQLGDGTTENRRRPTEVAGLTGVAAIAVGMYHSLALKTGGTVWAWGPHGDGKLDRSIDENGYRPVQIQGLTEAVAVAAGGDHCLALRADGTVWGWGNNSCGQLGDGTTEHRGAPVEARGLADVAAISAGCWHSLALRTDGTVWAWGWNEYGQLGDGTTAARNVPAQVKGLAGVTAIAAGALHSLALKADGTVWAWGGNYVGQLGDGSTGERCSSPVQVRALSGVEGIAAGGGYSVALGADGTKWTWGDNQYCQLGDGTRARRGQPVQVQGLTGVRLSAFTRITDVTD